ncbi:hypothetical protein DFH07DRAFT_856894 [Mycena maculata]|uniref:Uncharacterized protein n=1 Tax=Mycena maculata TaxID=230809 RepID=A0AAD7MLQ5_9AGAR|nr:hypothetical protein DFH07DRAFT_856894 [Mycena maculata]
MLGALPVLLIPWTDPLTFPELPITRLSPIGQNVKSILIYDMPYQCSTCARLGRHCTSHLWYLPCAACLVSGEADCTYADRVAFMVSVSCLYSWLLSHHDPDSDIIQQFYADLAEAFAQFSLVQGYFERYQSNGLRDVLSTKQGLSANSIACVLAAELNFAPRLRDIIDERPFTYPPFYLR